MPDRSKPFDVTAEHPAWADPRAKLREALKHDRFLLLSQRIEPLREDLVGPHCCEVLLRMQEEEDHLLPPGGFFPYAEQYGLMPSIDRWVLRTLIGWCADEQQRRPRWHPPVFWVNLSQAAVESAEFVRSVHREVQGTGFDGRLLCFELADTTLAAPPSPGRAACRSTS